jgi:hypothetical protein
MNTRKRIYSLCFSIFFLLLINILRITLFSFLLINDYVYYDIFHKIFWYFLSIPIVLGIWFFSVYLFKIKNIPIYSDIKLIFLSIRRNIN